ncbi:hypothetical protein TNCV_854941 [Trichonephila clavipes]|nr:hypothetical protein TNCV_854941 [Trichonephila clavipes]
MGLSPCVLVCPRRVEGLYVKSDEVQSSPVRLVRQFREGDASSGVVFVTSPRCRNCGGGDRGRVAIYRPFGELRRAKIVLSPVWCSRPTTGVPLAHATMNFVGLDLTASDRLAPHSLRNAGLCSQARGRHVMSPSPFAIKEPAV